MGSPRVPGMKSAHPLNFQGSFGTRKGIQFWDMMRGNRAGILPSARELGARGTLYAPRARERAGPFCGNARESRKPRGNGAGTARDRPISVRGQSRAARERALILRPRGDRAGHFPIPRGNRAGTWRGACGPRGTQARDQKARGNREAHPPSAQESRGNSAGPRRGTRRRAGIARERAGIARERTEIAREPRGTYGARDPSSARLRARGNPRGNLGARGKRAELSVNMCGGSRAARELRTRGKSAGSARDQNPLCSRCLTSGAWPRAASCGVVGRRVV
jgi:hypothetical protein